MATRTVKKTSSWWSYKTSIPKDLKYLLLHESPWESKTVNSFLPKWYFSMATIGHFMKTSDKELDIDLNTWEQNLKVDWTKKDIIANIKDAIEIVRSNWWKVVLCWDPDREWALINQEIIKHFKLKKNEYIVHRDPTSLVEKEYMSWITNPKEDLDWNLVAAWESRQVLDKFVWWSLTEQLWWKSNNYSLYKTNFETYLKDKITSFTTENKSVVERVPSVRKIVDTFNALDFSTLDKFDERKWISFWRVQTAWLILLVKKELEKFDKKLEFKLNLQAADSKKLTWDYIDQEAENLSDIYNEIKEGVTSISVSDIKRTIKKVSPPDTLDTLRAQTSLWSTFNYNLNTIMSVLQFLYEGWLTTYMRTDTNATSEAYEDYIKEIIEEGTSSKYVYRKYEEKDAQAWHLWILPTQTYDIKKLKTIKTKTGQVLWEEQYNVFDYVVRRSVAAFMEEAEIEYFTYEFEVKTNKWNVYKFLLKDSDIVKEWFLEVFTYWRDKYQKKVSYQLWAKIDVNEWILREKEIKLPGGYTETSFVSELKKYGIWRPSTWASIVETLKEKKYIKVTSWKLVVTPKWYWVYQTVVQDQGDFWRFNDLTFTKQMEDDLDLVAQWKLSKQKVLDWIKTEVDSIKKTVIENSSTKVWWDKEYICECKACWKGQIEKKNVAWKIAYWCSNWQSCKFTLWSPTAWHEFTEEEVKYTVENNETPLITDFISKAWKQFQAKLVFNKRKWFEFEF